MDGIIVVDKPPDLTSAKLVSRVKRILKAEKAGHAGTLDPFATGVMICLINRGTRLAEFFLHGNKTYRATLCLGIETDTDDFTGNVVQTREVRPGDYSETDIRSACGAFEGNIQQTPSCFSALKHQGKPLYHYARKGIKVEKPPRPVHIFSLAVESINLPFIDFTVRCSAGTYIRTLCRDIGRVLGCGAHLTVLRRTEAGGFGLPDAAGLPELEQLAAEGSAAGRLIGMSEALRDMPAYVADDGLAALVGHGRSLEEDTLPPDLPVDAGCCCKLVDGSGRLLAVIRRQGGTFRYGCVFPQAEKGRSPSPF
ncbi:MAG: tRNA pseudouridine(55) synthase TruB [Thermodesulfobacteriota bacterium]